MPKKLTQEQIDRYRLDGFLSPVDIFTEDQALAFRERLEDAEHKWPQAFAGAARNNPHLNLMFLDDMVHDSGLLDAVEDVIGPNILVWGVVLFIKEPHDPGFVSWHQDATYMGLEPHDGITAWIALSHSNRESGCMRMIPGTHKDQIRPHDDTFADTNILTRGQKIKDVDESQAVDLLLTPGQASFHDPRVIHGSMPNMSGDRRIGIVIQSYLPPHVRQTKAEGFVQVARGTDTLNLSTHIQRPQSDMATDDIALRDHVNHIWSTVLYDGAAKQRDY